MEGFRNITFASLQEPEFYDDVPLPDGGPPPAPPPSAPPMPQPPSLPPTEEIPVPPPPPPTVVPKPSQKGIAQAKKMLRAFSIQRKQTAPNLLKMAGPKPPGAGDTTKLKPPKPEKAKKPSASNPIFKPLDEEKILTDAENEEMRRKMEIAELGIPLSLLQPGDQAMKNKAWPSKAMPPTYLLSPEQVNDVLMKARSAKAQGKPYKFDIKKYFPDYGNPFQQGRKREVRGGSPIDIITDEKGRDKSKKESSRRQSRWEAGSSKDYKHKKDSKTKIKEDINKEVNLTDYVVCDSWSLDTEERTDDGTPKSECKSVKGADEAGIAKISESENKFVEVSDISISKPIDRPKDRDGTKSVDSVSVENVQLPLKVEEYNPQKLLLDTIAAEKLAKEKLRPVVDEFIYDLGDDSSEDSLDAPGKKQKGIPKADPDTKVKTSDKPKDKEEIFHTLDDIPLPKSESNSPKVPKDSKERSNKRDKSSSTSRLSSSRKNRSLETPDYLNEDVSKHSTDIKPSTALTPSTDVDKSDGDKYSEPLTPEFDEESRTDHSVEPRQTDTPAAAKISKEMEDCLDTWNFVLKICQPLLFRHDRNKCYKETKAQPPVWFTENPRGCNCVKDRGVVYEELDVTKMDLVDRVYGCDQISDETPLPCQFWYPKENYCVSEVSTIPPEVFPAPAIPNVPATEGKNKKSKDDQRNSLDREYEKFMEAVWTDKTKSPDEETNKKDRSKIKNDRQKAKDATSELGTSMDESVFSVEDEEIRKNKTKKDKTKKTKASSEYWSEDSDVSKSEKKKPDKKDDKKRSSKRKERKKSTSSSSESDSSSEDSDSYDSKERRKQDKKKKLSKAAKGKLSRKKRLEKKRRLKKLKEKRLKKIKKLKEKVQRSLEDDEDVGDIIKKEKQKKKEEGKDKKRRRKRSKEEIKKKKVSSSSSSSSSSTVSSSSSEEEKEKLKKKKKQKEAIKDSKKKQKLKKKRKPSESYSDEEEEFDMNILNNIKMEQLSDDEVQKEQIEDFSPRRPCHKAKEIVSVSELHSDFVGRSIKKEHISVELDELEATDEIVAEVETAKVNDKRVQEVKISEVSPVESIRDDKASPKVIEDSSQDSSIASVKTSKSGPELKPPTPEDSIPSPMSQTSQEKDTFPRPSSQNSNYSFADVIASQKETDSKHRQEASVVTDAKPIEVTVHNKAVYDSESYAEYAALEIPHPVEKPALHYYPTEEARPIETVVSATSSRGEIKCDWTPKDTRTVSHVARTSRWGMQSKPGNANIVLTSPDLYQVGADSGRQYKIETISNVRGAAECDYDGAYADMYGESDRLRYGDCFAEQNLTAVATPSANKRLSLDDRIGLVLQGSVLGQVAKQESQESPVRQFETPTPTAPVSRDVPARAIPAALKPNRNKRVRFADGYNPGQDSDNEEPPAKRRKPRRRYGCAWPCPAGHADHEPLWDALPPPPPPPGSPPPPRAPPPDPALLRQAKRRREADDLSQAVAAVHEPSSKITRLPRVLSHPPL